MRTRSLGELPVRLGCLLAGIWFISLDHNPIVRLEAKLGLSPAPLERIVHVRGPFSGMTEGMHQLATGDWRQAGEANVLTPFVAAAIVVFVVLGRVPHIQNRRDEALFFAGAIVATLIVNAVHGTVGS